MITETKSIFKELEEKIELIQKFLDIPSLSRELEEVDGLLSSSAIWDSPSKSKDLLKRRVDLSFKLDSLKEFNRKFKDFGEMIDLASSENDDEFISCVFKDIKDFDQIVDRFRLNLAFKEPSDKASAIMTIHAGSGGLEAKDWTGIVYRMYSRWAMAHGFQVELLHYAPSDEGTAQCVDSVSIKIEGQNAYGYLKGEAGVHRLVRNSPFDASNARHTSFCAVEVLPDAEDDITIEIKDSDLEIQAIRGSGSGGQNVNKVSSCIRLKHIPSGIMILSRTERDQHQNKRIALSRLKAALYKRELDKKQKEIDEKNEEKMQISWGSQIRSYVLSPHQMVTDHRTEVKVTNADNVLDGDLDTFVKSFIFKK